MAGSVFEWVDQAFYPITNERNYKRDYGKVNRKYREAVFAPEWNFDEKVIKGGSFQMHTEELGRMVFRAGFRQGVHEARPADAIGFRVAKSGRPGRDTMAITLGRDYVSEELGELKIVRDEGGGIEHWDLTDGGLINGHHVVAFTTIERFPEYDTEKRLEETSLDKPVPFAVMVTSEPLATPRLEPGIYTVYYRAKGISAALERAIKDARQHLKAGRKLDDIDEKMSWPRFITEYGITEAFLATKESEPKTVAFAGLMVSIKDPMLVFLSNAKLPDGTQTGAVIEAKAEVKHERNVKQGNEFAYDDSKDLIHFVARVPAKARDQKFRFVLPVAMERGKLTAQRWIRAE
jgi:hypothetical protein